MRSGNNLFGENHHRCRRDYAEEEDGNNQTFKSDASGIELAAAGGKEAVIVHQCAYDEVIGHDPCLREDPALRTPMDLRLLASLG